MAFSDSLARLHTVANTGAFEVFGPGWRQTIIEDLRIVVHVLDQLALVASVEMDSPRAAQLQINSFMAKSLAFLDGFSPVDLVQAHTAHCAGCAICDRWRRLLGMRGMFDEKR